MQLIPVYCAYITSFQDMEVLDGWLQLDSRPFKQALLNTIKRWSLMFKQYLMEHVINRYVSYYFWGINYEFGMDCLVFSLNGLENFISTSIQGMTGSVEEGDYQGLVDVMGRLLAVKGKQAIADTLFGPLTETVELLKTYQQELPESVHLQLQVLGSYLLCAPM